MRPPFALTRRVLTVTVAVTVAVSAVAAGTSGAVADGAQQQVLGRVREVDELDDVDAVAQQPQQPRAQVVGERVADALPDEVV